MLRVGIIDLFVVGSCIATILGYYNSRMKKKNKEFSTVAKFVGGPLDGTERTIGHPDSLFVYKHKNLPGDAVYKHRGDGIYEFDEYVEG